MAAAHTKGITALICGLLALFARTAPAANAAPNRPENSSAATTARASTATAADLVFTQGAVYTLDAARRWASAVAVYDGKIVYVGNDTGAQAFIGATTRVVPLHGRMLLPSFQDSHAHASHVPNPETHLDLDGLETAVTHRYPGGRMPDGKEDQAWNPDQRLSLERALAAYTSSSAALLGESARRGSIEVGKDADLVVLGRNLFETPPGEIHSVPIELTLRGGQILYAAER